MEDFQKAIANHQALQRQQIFNSFTNNGSDELEKGGKTPRQQAVDKLNSISRDSKAQKHQAGMIASGRHGGEGSRGGKIISHTKSGKPIYDTANHSSHKDFTSADHSDAQEAHLGKMQKLNKQKENHEANNEDEDVKSINDEQDNHRKQISEHYIAGKKVSGKKPLTDEQRLKGIKAAMPDASDEEHQKVFNATAASVKKDNDRLKD